MCACVEMFWPVIKRAPAVEGTDARLIATSLFGCQTAEVAGLCGIFCLFLSS